MRGAVVRNFLELQSKGLVLMLWFQIPLLDVKTAPLDETACIEVLCCSRCWDKKDPSQKGGYS